MSQGKKFTNVLRLSQKILKEYDLCDHCLGRLFAKKIGLTSNKILGQKIYKSLKKKNMKCHICKNIFDSIQHYLVKMSDVSSDYDFKTFLVGAKLKPSILDRDDHVRSQFKLKGIDSIKTNITRELVKQFAQKTKKKHQQLDPDLTLTVDFKTESCDIQSRSVFVSGRYVKNIRSIPQKQKPCSNCLGKGCLACNRHGISEFDSIEGMISRYLFEKFVAVQTKITWIGGEDSTSLVLGSGRPFFAKLTNPKKRNPKLPKKTKAGKITLNSLKQITRIPAGPMPFVSKTKLLVTTENPIRQEDLTKLDQLRKSTIAVYENSGKRAEKSIHAICYKINSENSFYLFMRVDGGVPLKRFVTGDNVFPNISDVIANKSKCDTFDFEEIKIVN